MNLRYRLFLCIPIYILIEIEFMKSEYSDHSLKGQSDYPDEGGSAKKYYSILPDLATGWRPKNLNIPAPILITYH